ncbi:MAG: hypothetical protein A3E78_08455 [Alphaproteobacteria bacterium RIFCSPHIGHO2_12_FULL_63_12]|nr:MAG: hypothetical protein A3E78_08455 [Alphaproteobacteria bacterium RIFCSPHIGHO2_12_FULL_63_12]
MIPSHVRFSGLPSPTFGDEPLKTEEEKDLHRQDVELIETAAVAADVFEERGDELRAAECRMIASCDTRAWLDAALPVIPLVADVVLAWISDESVMFIDGVGSDVVRQLVDRVVAVCFASSSFEDAFLPSLVARRIHDADPVRYDDIVGAAV